MISTESHTLIVQCCVCFATRNDDNTWKPHTEKLQDASHTYCDECAKPLWDQLNQYRAQKLTVQSIQG